MNQFETRRAEVGKVARLLVFTVSRLERVDYRNSPENLTILSAIRRIIRHHIKQEKFDATDVKLVTKALNLPVTTLLVEKRDDTRHGIIWFLNPVVDQVRFMAEYLLKYLDCFLKTPQLMEVNPLGICLNPKCDAVFLKRKSHQEYCSPTCREKAWRARKLTKDPGYYAEKARIARFRKKQRRQMARRKLAAARQAKAQKSTRRPLPSRRSLKGYS